jgi:hypothetical protein
MTTIRLETCLPCRVPLFVREQHENQAKHQLRETTMSRGAIILWLLMLDDG